MHMLSLSWRLWRISFCEYDSVIRSLVDRDHESKLDKFQFYVFSFRFKRSTLREFLSTLVCRQSSPTLPEVQVGVFRYVCLVVFKQENINRPCRFLVRLSVFEHSFSSAHNTTGLNHIPYELKSTDNISRKQRTMKILCWRAKN